MSLSLLRQYKPTLKDEGGKTRIWPSTKFLKQMTDSEKKLERSKVASFLEAKEVKKKTTLKVSISFFQFKDFVTCLHVAQFSDFCRLKGLFTSRESKKDQRTSKRDQHCLELFSFENKNENDRSEVFIIDENPRM